MSTGPSGDVTDDGSVDTPPANLRREFWILVALFNIGLMGIGLGILLVVFEPGSGIGWPVLGLGLAAGGYGFGRYRRRERERRTAEDNERQD